MLVVMGIVLMGGGLVMMDNSGPKDTTGVNIGFALMILGFALIMGVVYLDYAT